MLIFSNRGKVRISEKLPQAHPAETSLTGRPQVCNLGPAFDNRQPKHSDEPPVRVEHDDMISLNFGTIRNQRLSTDRGVLEPNQICFVCLFQVQVDRRQPSTYGQQPPGRASPCLPKPIVSRRHDPFQNKSRIREIRPKLRFSPESDSMSGLALTTAFARCDRRRCGPPT